MVGYSLHLFIIIVLSGLLAFPKDIAAQRISSPFGQNKIQHKDFKWYFYRTENFDIYYHGNGKNLARFAGKHAKQHLEQIENFLDYRADDRLIMIIYNSLSDFDQTNIGYSFEKENSPGGKTQIVDNQAFLYFNGDHFDFINQLRGAISKVLVNEMLYGGSIEERVQNSTLLNLPGWYLKGLHEYIANSWDVNDQEKFRNKILSGRFRKFGVLTNEEKVMVSQSIWRYVAEQYGESAVSNIIYLTRINKSLESGYVFVLGKNFNELFIEWYNHHRKLFNDEQKKFQNPSGFADIDDKAIKQQGRITDIKLSYDERYLAYITNDRGRRKVWIYDKEEDKRFKVYKDGHRSANFDTDYTYPIMAWHPRKQLLTIIHEDQATPEFIQYNVKADEVEDKRKNFRLDKVLDLSYSQDGRLMALSGIRNGQSDIYVFNWRTNAMRGITNDIYDDLHPSFVRDGKGIVFSSNRSESTIEKRGAKDLKGFDNNYDIFYFNYEERSKDLRRITRTNHADEFHPNAYDSTYFSYLTDENGILNRDAAYLDRIFKRTEAVVQYEDTAKYSNDTFTFKTEGLDAVKISPWQFQNRTIRQIDTNQIYKDTSYTYRITNYSHNIKNYEISDRSNTTMEYFKIEDEIKLLKQPIPDSIRKQTVKRSSTSFEASVLQNTQSRKSSYAVKEGEPKKPGQPNGSGENSDADTGEININNYYFQSEYPEENNDKEITEKATKDKDQPNVREGIEDESSIELGNARLYFLNFTPEHLVSQLDNSIINTPYLPYNQNNPQAFVYNPVLNATIKLGISDLFKDYRILGGFRILGNLKGADYFMTFKNLKDRLDKKLLFFRHGKTNEQGGNNITKETSHELRYSLRWPFSQTSSIRGEVFGRRDNNKTLSTDRTSLEKENDAQNWMGLHFEYVFDNTMDLGTNLQRGIKFKLYSDLFRSFDFQKDEGDNLGISVIGGDFRTYLPIFREFIWANRFSFASSFGNAKVVYFMGGVENWLFPKFNEGVEVDPNQNYVYKSLAANLRGFTQNIRNGNSYSLINSELRIPIFKLFQNKPIKSKFFENFQIIGFADVGSAWSGENPFSEQNALNRKNKTKEPIDITVINLSNPIVGGYGLGLRTNLLGYFIRLDHAWGYEDYQFKEKGVTYLSLGLDF